MYAREVACLSLEWVLEPRAFSQRAFRGQLGVITVGGFLVYVFSEDPQTLQAATIRLDNQTAFAIPTV